jgi:hypothetical protein
MADGGSHARRVRQPQERLPEVMHVEVGRMDARARPQPWGGERPQGVGCRPWLERQAHALGRIRWVSHQALCRGVMGVPGPERRRGRAGRWRLAGCALLALLMLGGGLCPQTTRPVGYVVPIAGMIDLRTRMYVAPMRQFIPTGCLRW